MSANNYTYPIVDIDGKEYSSPSYFPDFPISGYGYHIISPEEQYRADKIAYAIYGDDRLSWVLDVANNFYNGFSEYTSGREIKFPLVEGLIQMGIL